MNLDDIRRNLEGEVAVVQKRPGCCIWVSGETRSNAAALKRMGFRFSRRKAAWWRKDD